MASPETSPKPGKKPAVKKQYSRMRNNSAVANAIALSLFQQPPIDPSKNSEPEKKRIKFLGTSDASVMIDQPVSAKSNPATAAPAAAKSTTATPASTVTAVTATTTPTSNWSPLSDGILKAPGVHAKAFEELARSVDKRIDDVLYGNKTRRPRLPVFIDICPE